MDRTGLPKISKRRSKRPDMRDGEIDRGGPFRIGTLITAGWDEFFDDPGIDLPDRAQPLHPHAGTGSAAS